MPEYLAPGVFVEEVSYRAKSIEGVSTTTTGFVGPTRYGPIDLEPDIITSLVEFERVYGGHQPLEFTDAGAPTDNYMWNAVRAFFEEGGKRLYVARAYSSAHTVAGDPNLDDACARVVGPLVPPANISIRARFPGRAGQSRVRLQLVVSANRLTAEDGRAVLKGVTDRDVVYIANHPAVGGNTSNLYLASYDVQQDLWTFDDGEGQSFGLQTLFGTGATVRTISATVLVEPTSAGLEAFAIGGLALDRQHKIAGKPDSLFDYFAAEPANPGAARGIPIVIEALSAEDALEERDHAQEVAEDAADANTAAQQAVDDAQDAVDAAQAAVDTPPAGSDPDDLQATLDEAAADLVAAEAALALTTADLTAANARLATANGVLTAANAGAQRSGVQIARDYVANITTPNRFTMAELAANTGASPLLDAVFFLTGGDDGQIPNQLAYEGIEDDDNRKSGLKAFEDIEDISIVAAPGHSFNDTNAQSIANVLISHAERMRYRIAVLDSVRGHSIAQVREYRGKFDSKYAAFYYPWVRIIDAETGQENHYPPSGFVAGIYARNDVERAVYKAPANEVVRLALGFEKFLNKAQQEVLNPEGINCFRFFEGRGMRLWGARTATSDPEWKYVNLRRYFAYLERSIDKGTQWAVFEPNGERLWANVRRTIEDFLLNEWQNGALLGDRPEKAYFVKCDRSTMTQNDLDNGRLVCQVGVAALRPAEFVIFRIGQWTADRKA